MTDWDALQRRVAAACDAQRLRTWPNPHPDMAEPAQDEYSRVTDPERYRIVQERLRVWREALIEIPGVSAEHIVAGNADPDRVTQVRCVRVSSPTPGTLALVLLEQDVRLTSGEGVLPVVRIAVERPDLLVEAPTKASVRSGRRTASPVARSWQIW